MVIYGEVEKLRGCTAADQSLLSLYVYVPPDTRDVPDLLARTVELIEVATERAPDTLRCEDELLARRTLAEYAPDWPGHTLGIFVSGQLGLLEVVPMPGRFAERAVIGARPHLRPLLAAVQRYPDHRIVIIEHHHAWLLAVAGDRIEIVATVPAEATPSGGFGGWYLESSHGLQRVTELTPHLYQDAAAVIEREARHGLSAPIVIGGPADSITHLIALLSHTALAEYAGSFAADPHTLTLSRARDRAGEVLLHWAHRREHQLAQTITAPRPGVPTAIGLDDCLAAVNAGTPGLVLIADEPIVPGFHCERCDVLSLGRDGCCDWGAASWPVPDLLEEMAWRTLSGGGQVVSVGTLPCLAAARLTAGSRDEQRELEVASAGSAT